VLLVRAGLRDGRKVILALESGHRESTESWAGILRDLKRRGLNFPKFLIADCHLGIWAGARAGVSGQKPGFLTGCSSILATRHFPRGASPLPRESRSYPRTPKVSHRGPSPRSASRTRRSSSGLPV
jgi:hypothetical protein